MHVVPSTIHAILQYMTASYIQTEYCCKVEVGQANVLLRYTYIHTCVVWDSLKNVTFILFHHRRDSGILD